MWGIVDDLKYLGILRDSRLLKSVFWKEATFDLVLKVERVSKTQTLGMASLGSRIRKTVQAGKRGRL